METVESTPRLAVREAVGTRCGSSAGKDCGNCWECKRGGSLGTPASRGEPGSEGPGVGMDSEWKHLCPCSWGHGTRADRAPAGRPSCCSRTTTSEWLNGGEWWCWGMQGGWRCEGNREMLAKHTNSQIKSKIVLESNIQHSDYR